MPELLRDDFSAAISGLVTNVGEWMLKHFSIKLNHPCSRVVGNTAMPTWELYRVLLTWITNLKLNPINSLIRKKKVSVSINFKDEYFIDSSEKSVNTLQCSLRSHNRFCRTGEKWRSTIQLIFIPCWKRLSALEEFSVRMVCVISINVLHKRKFVGTSFANENDFHGIPNLLSFIHLLLHLPKIETIKASGILSSMHMEILPSAVEYERKLVLKMECTRWFDIKSIKSRAFLSLMWISGVKLVLLSLLLIFLGIWLDLVAVDYDPGNFE